MTYKNLIVEEHEKWIEVKINRPKSMNALNLELTNELDECLDHYKSDEKRQLIILRGEGKAFVAGADIQAMQNMTPSQATNFALKVQEVMKKIESHPMLVVAVINGFALGGGMELAMACDYRLASDQAQFGQPEVNLGLVSGFAASQRLARMCNLGDALYMLTTAEIISAFEALQMRLVQKVFPHHEMEEHIVKFANNICSKGPKAIRKMKSLVHRGIHMKFDKACAMEAHEFGSLFGIQSQGYEGMTAFLEKRRPIWSEEKINQS